MIFDWSADDSYMSVGYVGIVFGHAAVGPAGAVPPSGMAITEDVLLTWLW